jgi:tetratricopeptide (TPR) repeat protein
MSRFRSLLVLILITTPCFASAPTWVEVHSKNFNVLTDAGEKRGQEVARRFEEVRSAFGAIFQKMNVNSSVPLQIIAFRNNKELKQYGPVWKGKAVEVDGFFQGSKDKNFVVLDLSSEGGWHVVFHEYMHLLINTNMPPTPAWFDEGFADYFSTLTVNGKTIEFGNIPEGYPDLLSTSRWMKTSDLFSVQHNSSEYNEGDRRSLFYAQSWLTIHYVMTQQKLPIATKYLDLTINQHRGVDEAIQMAFGITPQQFDKALRDYFTSRSMIFRLAAPPNMESGPFEAKAADPMFVEASLADLHFHEIDHQEEGISEFKKIIEKDANNLIAQRGLGYAYLQKNDYEHAAEHLERAAAADAKDPEVHYFNAMVTSQRGGDVAKVRAELLKVVELNPNHAEALTMLGITEAQSGNKKDAVKYARRAVQLGPRNEYYISNLVFAQLQNELFDDAEPNLKLLAASTNPDIAQNAQRNLQQVQQMKQWKQQQAARMAEEEARVAENDKAYNESVARLQKATDGNAVSAGGKRKIVHVDQVPYAGAEEVQVLPSRPGGYAKGVLQGVECDGDSAILHLIASGKPLNLQVKDIRRVVVINADGFSCGWRNRTVGVNYAADTNAVISVEIY